MTDWRPMTDQGALEGLGGGVTPQVAGMDLCGDEQLQGWGWGV